MYSIVQFVMDYMVYTSSDSDVESWPGQGNVLDVGHVTEKLIHETNTNETEQTGTNKDRRDRFRTVS